MDDWEGGPMKGQLRQQGRAQLGAWPAYPELIALIPAYNEEPSIGTVVLKAGSFADCVMVVDDGSTDNTAEIATLAGALVLRHQCNLGKGAALNTGFRRACQLGAEIVVTLDADGQHLAEELSLVVEPVRAGRADLVVGSRYLAGDNPVPRHRIWGHRLFNLITNGASGTSLSDSQSGFRAFSRAALEALSFCSNGFSVESEMQFLAHEFGLTVVEVPITVRYDRKPKRPVLQHGLLVLNGLLRLAGQYRPLLFFGMTGLVLLAPAVIWTGIVVTNYYRTLELAMADVLMIVLLFLLGSISMSTGIMLHSVRALLLSLFERYEQKS